MKFSYLLLLPLLFSSQTYAMDTTPEKKITSKKKSETAQAKDDQKLSKVSQDALKNEKRIDKSTKNKNPIDTSSNPLQDIANKNQSTGKESHHEEYNSDDEYARHQAVSDRFFKRPSSKREMIRQARNQLKSNTNIILDGLSSRTRIFLFRELTAFACAKKIQSIPCIFHTKEFKIILDPSLRQPGDGRIDSIEKYKDIYETIHSFSPEYQKKIAKKLVAARKAKPYHPNIPHPIISLEGKALNLEMLNILLDFEVARRLQEAVKEDKSTFKKHIKKSDEINETNAAIEYEDYPDGPKRKIFLMRQDKDCLDKIPVASAIVGILKLSTKRESPELLEIFFHAPDDDRGGDKKNYSAGEFNAFEGLPSGGRREKATKTIIGMINSKKHSTKEEIHKGYLEFFGGSTESEGESYSETASEDSRESKKSSIKTSPSEPQKKISTDRTKPQADESKKSFSKSDSDTRSSSSSSSEEKLSKAPVQKSKSPVTKVPPSATKSATLVSSKPTKPIKSSVDKGISQSDNKIKSRDKKSDKGKKK